MAHYRHEWTNDANGWGHRFDIVPYGSTISASTTALGAFCVMTDSFTQECGFDELPMGLMDATTMDVQLVLDLLPTAVQTALETYTDGSGARNLFLFWTDRGTSGATWTLEFCGTEEKIENFDSDQNELGQEVVTLHLVDALYHTMLTLKAEDVFSTSLFSGIRYNRIFDVATPDYVGTELHADAEDFLNFTAGTRTKFEARLTSFDTVMTRIKTQCTDYLVTNLTQTGNGSASAITNAADIDARLPDIIHTGARFYKASTTSPRVQSTALTPTTALLITHVTDNADNVVGGLFSPNDDYSWSKQQSLLDVMKQLCETMVVKAAWFPRYVTDAGGDYIDWRWQVCTLFGNGRSDGALTTLDMSTAESQGTLSGGAGAIARTEIRTSVSSVHADRNATEIEFTDGRSYAERSYNTEPLIHNMPSTKDRVWHIGGAWNAYQRGIVQTNIICYDSDGTDQQADKAHEDTRIVVQGAAAAGTATVYLDVTNANALPTISSDEFENGAGLDTDLQQNGILQAWINDVQRTSCLPYAWAKAVYQSFYSPLQSQVEITWRVDANSVPSTLPNVYTLSGNRATRWPSRNWTRATVTRVSTDWGAGTSTVTYLLPDLGLF